MRNLTRFSRVAIAATIFAFGTSGAAMAYDTVVHNETELQVVDGFAHYASALCSDDSFSIEPGQTLNVDGGRGACLLLSLSGRLCKPRDEYGGQTCYDAVSYSSSGTGYECFKVTKTGSMPPFQFVSC